MIHLTPAALKAIGRFVKATETPVAGLRIFVSGGLDEAADCLHRGGGQMDHELLSLRWGGFPEFILASFVPALPITRNTMNLHAFRDFTRSGVGV